MSTAPMVPTRRKISVEQAFKAGFRAGSRGANVPSACEETFCKDAWLQYKKGRTYDPR